MRKPAKKLHRGIICQNGNRMGTKRLKGGREAIHRTIDVQLKCHIAKVICMLFNWGSRKILRSTSVLEDLGEIMPLKTYHLFKNTNITVLAMFNIMHAPSIIVDRSPFFASGSAFSIDVVSSPSSSSSKPVLLISIPPSVSVSGMTGEGG